MHDSEQHFYVRVMLLLCSNALQTSQIEKSLSASLDKQKTNMHLEATFITKLVVYQLTHKFWMSQLPNSTMNVQYWHTNQPMLTMVLPCNNNIT